MSFSNPFILVKSVFGEALRAARISADRPEDRIPAGQIDRSLNDWCRPSYDANSGQYVPLAPRSFNNIRSLLSRSDDPVKQIEWSKRPRIYCILRNIDRLDVMSEFVRHRYLDDMLPFNESELPQSLRESRPAFVEMQGLCLTPAVEIEKGEKGRHIQFHYDADIHFYHIKELGGGGYGVDHVWSGLSHRHYARKKFLRKLSPQETKRQFDWFEREIGALKRLSHRHLVKIKGTYSDPRCFAFLMDPIAKCDLSQYLLNMKDELLPNLRYFFGCLAGAIDYLHKEKVYHMDIKLRNILVKGNNIYVTDFGAAHDWSKKDRSTTYSPGPRTLRYVPPEHVHDLNAPKNYAFDIWSLGVVFLEMATVLRGTNVKDFDTFLSTHGSHGLAVYNNPVATNHWLGKLRKQPGPDYDNMPLMWVKDMLVPDPQKRPLARQIHGQILDSHGFCGTCCAVPELEWEHLPRPGLNRGDLSDDESVVEYIDAEEQTNNVHEGWQKYTKISEPQGRTTIQAWMDRTEVARMERANTTAETEGLPFDVEDEDANTGAPSDQEANVIEIVSDPVPERLSNISLFAEVKERQRAADRTETVSIFDIESDGSAPSEVSALVPIVDDNDADAEFATIRRQLDDMEKDIEIPLSPDLETIDEESEVFYDIDPGMAEELVATEVVNGSKDCGTQEPTSSQIVRENTILNDGKSSETQHGLLKGNSQPTEKCDHESGDEDKKEKEETKEQEIVNKSNDRLIEPASGLEGNTLREDMDLKLDEEHEIMAERENDEGTNVSYALPPPTTSPAPTRQVPPQQLHSARPDRLTIRNLQQLEADNRSISSDGKRRKIRLKGKISAKKYMQQVCKKEKTDAATSVMSERTRKKLKGQLITVWMNESSPILENYVRKGGVAAVRALLEAGCNPGTKRKPRPGPLLAAVKGASLRHNKCADALLQAGADVNIKTSRTGKTPLSLAIEHESFPGYRGLIWTLLHYGADPNIKDRNGDYPLLQILYNGYEPLEEHRRQALALILEESRFKTNVNVEPPGNLNMPLHLAARRKDPYAVGMLLEKGAKLNTKNGAGQSPFAVAVSTWTRKMKDDHKQVARLLLSRGANANEALGMDKVPALHSAIRHGHADLVELLMYYSADPSRKDAKGKDAYMFCEEMLNKNNITQETADEFKSLLDLHNSSDWWSEQSSADD